MMRVFLTPKRQNKTKWLHSLVKRSRTQDRSCLPTNAVPLDDQVKFMENYPGVSDATATFVRFLIAAGAMLPFADWTKIEVLVAGDVACWLTESTSSHPPPSLHRP